MIHNYIFDLYGTLVDIHTDETMPSLWRRMALLLSFQGASYSPEELQKAYQSAVSEQIDRRAEELPAVIKAHIEPDILPAFESLYKQKGASVSTDTVLDAAVFFRTLSLRHLRLYPDAKKVLRTLRERGNGVYLLSNAQAAFTVPELKTLGLIPLFDGIVLSSNVGVKKPDKSIFFHMLNKYGIHSEDCLMIGNDEEADIIGARSVGMAACYIHTKQSPSRKGALPEGTREIKRLMDIL